MSTQFRIVLEDRLLPVQAFFNAISDDSFLPTLEAFSRGVGAGFNDCHCEFPGDLEPDDDPIDGILFALHEQEVVISNAEFIAYLKTVCNSFVEARPNVKSEVSIKLDSIEQLLG